VARSRRLENLQTDKLSAPENSKVLSNQKQLLKATQVTLNAVYQDVQMGLLETVGVNCTLVTDERCSVALDLPEGTDTELVARAIDLENVEAWRDPQGKVNVAVNPWYSTKDVDQTVLSAVRLFTSCSVFTLPMGLLPDRKHLNRSYWLRLLRCLLSKKMSGGKNSLN
jgi:hypothetical protein